jgi:hypothetical protein
MESYKWNDKKGRVVYIHTMSDRWLKNIKRYLLRVRPDHPAVEAIRNELKRRRS